MKTWQWKVFHNKHAVSDAAIDVSLRTYKDNTRVWTNKRYKKALKRPIWLSIKPLTLQVVWAGVREKEL